jgi:1,4-dihydroxy-2-naphthoate octaprenyltransferase
VAAFSALMIQIGTNFVNDYYDFKKGSDTAERLGPTRVTQAGLVMPYQMKAAIAVAFALAIVGGLYLVLRGGWPILTIGLASIGCGVLYTAGPFSLSYTGLADLFVLLFFGLVAVAGTYYVQILAFSTTALIAGLGPGLFSVAILTVNNLRDIDQDRKAGKRSLPARFGRGFARAEYTVSIILATLVPVWLVLSQQAHYYALAASVTILFAVPAIRTVMKSTDGSTLNRTLAATGRLLLIYSLLFSIGWLL